MANTLAMRVLVADDHSIIRSGMRYLLDGLDDHVEVVGVSSIREVAGALGQGPGFDLVIVDLFMPVACAPRELAAVVDGAAPAPVVVFSRSESLSDIRLAFSSGAQGFVPKSTDDRQILGILRLVLEGGSYVPPGVVASDLDGMPSWSSVTAGADRLERLSGRQRQVLELVGEGLSNQQIADRLGLTLSTVKTHVTDILKALGVDNRTQAVLLLKGA